VSLLVVDASALVVMVVSRDARRRAVRRRLEGHVRHAPHLIDAEVGNALRRMVLRREVDPSDAQRSRLFAVRAISRRHDHGGALGDRAWQLRDNLSFYDGLYVALAEQLGCPLVTLDARIVRAPGVRCPVEVVTPT